MDSIGCIDYEGQQVATSIANYGLLGAGLLSFVAGFIKQDAWLSIFLFIVLSVLVMAAVVPPWPFLNKQAHKYTWIPSRYQAALKDLQAQLAQEQTHTTVDVKKAK